MVSIVHKTVRASTTRPATVLLAPAAVLLDTMATPVNTVGKHSPEAKRNFGDKAMRQWPLCHASVKGHSL